MERDTIFDIEKEQLKLLAEEMNLDNFEEIVEEINNHFNIIRLLKTVNYRKNQENDSEITVAVPEVIVEKETEDIIEAEANDVETPNILPLKEEEAKDGSWVIGTLIRELKGGYIGNNKKVYVPESIIRSLELNNLDWIKAEKSKYNRYDRPYYDFTLLEKSHIINYEDRREADFVCVHFEEFLKINYVNIKDGDSLTMRVKISDDDVRNYNISPGDVITYAYWKGDLLNGRVIWKYRTEDVSVGEMVNSNTVKNNTQTAKAHKVAKKTNQYTVKPIYKNQTIVMVGGSHGKLYKGIKEEVERRDGDFVFCSGDEPQATLESRIRKADAVVVFTQSISHEGMYASKEFCKKHNVPVTYTKNLGNNQFVGRVNKLLNIKVSSINDESKETPLTSNESYSI